MPTDGIFNRSFQSVFSGTVRYEIPFFQRGYAWIRDQWKQLLADLEEQVVAEVGDDGTFDDHEHFFGPVVVLEKTNAPHPSLKHFLVIDGQQRLTTVYVMLIVLHGLFKVKSHLSVAAEGYAEKLAPLLSNNLNVSGDSYLDFKSPQFQRRPATDLSCPNWAESYSCVSITICLPLFNYTASLMLYLQIS